METMDPVLLQSGRIHGVPNMSLNDSVPLKKAKIEVNSAMSESHFGYLSSDFLPPMGGACVDTWNVKSGSLKEGKGSVSVRSREESRKEKDVNENKGEKRAKVLIIPHNKLDEGVSELKYWYPWLKSQLSKTMDCQIGDMPDPHLGREVFWVPYMSEELHVDKNTVLIGHGIGASAVLRFAEDNQVAGIIAVDPACKHHDDPYLKAAYYFDREWNWDKIRSNSKWFFVFSSHCEIETCEENERSDHSNDSVQKRDPKADDIFTEQQISSLEEQKFVAAKLGVKLEPITTRHSFETTADQILDCLVSTVPLSAQ